MPYFRNDFTCQESGRYKVTFSARAVDRASLRKTKNKKVVATTSKALATIILYNGNFQIDGAVVRNVPIIKSTHSANKTQKTYTAIIELRKGDQLAFAAQVGTAFAIKKDVHIKGPLLNLPLKINSLLPNNIGTELNLLHSNNAEQDLKTILTSMGEKLYRQKPSPAEIQALVKKSLIHGGGKFSASLNFGLKTMLCSPRFLFKQKLSTGAKNLAEQLAFMLWRGLPDTQLLQAEKSGQLQQPEELRRQIQRLLKDPRSKRFVRDFSMQWLQLKSVPGKRVDFRAYPEHDLLLMQSMQRESIAFVDLLLRQNRPIKEIIDSDYLMINDRLAQHYGIKGVLGDEIRKVPRPSGSVRGGLLTQGAIMATTSDGSSTTPVKRGVWILERILGKHIPSPPKEVAGIETDLREKLTVIQQLEKHRNQGSCKSCHSYLDPYGVAFESLDVLGNFRNNYRQLSKKAKPVITRVKKGAFIEGAAVVSSYKMPNGQRYKDIRDFKQKLLQEEAHLIRNLSQKLMSFAISDELNLQQKLQATEIAESIHQKQGGLKDLLEAVLLSKAFTGKEN